jgi:predicted RNA-binding protein with PUA-like domain
MQYWLVKSEPTTYAYERLEKDKSTIWDGVRNYAARNNLRAMKKGDLALFYHSNEGKEIVGIAKILKESFPDPSAKEGDWAAVEIGLYKKLKKPIALEYIKSDKILKNMELVRLSRLSVCPVRKEEFDRILELSETK